MKNLKLISTILLSVMLMFTISTAVFADNETDDIWSDVNVTEENNTVENTTENTVNEAENQIVENVEVENNVIDEEENEYNNLYTTTNSTTANSENLADTGIENTGVFALIIIVSAVVAIYSAKKFNDYKNV